MARIGVAYRDVAEAADAVKRRGEEPTVDRVRAELGTGSKSTIAPLLKQWRTELLEEGVLQGLPADLVTALSALHQRTQQHAELQVEQMRAHITAAEQEHTEAQLRSKERIAELHRVATNLETELTQQKDALREQNQVLEQTRTALAKAELDRDYNAERADGLKVLAEEFRQENRDIRDHFEHYQQRVAEDRQRERSQFDLVKQQLQDQFKELTARLVRLEAELSAERTGKAALQQTADELRLAREQAHAEVQTLEASCLNLERELNERRDHCTALERGTALLNQQNGALSQQKNELLRENAVLSQTVASSESAAKAAEQSVLKLREQNTALIQEKAVIEGKLMQLQSMAATWFRQVDEDKAEKNI